LWNKAWSIIRRMIDMEKKDKVKELHDEITRQKVLVAGYQGGFSVAGFVICVWVLLRVIGVI
jgi:hypothetical protein